MTLFPLDATCNAIPSQALEPLLEDLRFRVAEHHFAEHVGTSDEVVAAFDASRARLNIVLEQLLKSAGGPGVDVGTGLGFLPVAAKEKGIEVVATELDPKVAEFAQGSGVQVVPHEIGREAYPFDPASFGFVVFSEVLEHLRLAPVPVLEQLAELLRPGGKLILTTPNIARLANIQALLAGENFLEPFPSDAGFGDALTFVEHIREYSVREVVEAVEAVGLGVESVLMTGFGRLGYEPLANPFANEIIVAVASK